MNQTGRAGNGMTGNVFEVLRGWFTALVVETGEGLRYVPEGTTVSEVVDTPASGETLPDNYIGTWLTVGRWTRADGAVVVSAAIRSEGSYGYDYVTTRDDHLRQMGIDPRGTVVGFEVTPSSRDC